MTEEIQTKNQPSELLLELRTELANTSGSESITANQTFRQKVEDQKKQLGEKEYAQIKKEIRKKGHDSAMDSAEEIIKYGDNLIDESMPKHSDSSILSVAKSLNFIQTDTGNYDLARMLKLREMVSNAQRKHFENDMVNATRSRTQKMHNQLPLLEKHNVLLSEDYTFLLDLFEKDLGLK